MRLEPATLCTAWARRFARAAIDFVYPPACALCEVELSESSKDGSSAFFCEACRDAFVDARTPCRRCGAPVGPNLDASGPCGYCREDRFAFERVIRLGVYDGPLRAACLRAKERAGESVAAGLADLAWGTSRRAFEETPIDVVVPVPQDRWQRLVRPYHAADTLAEVWARRLQVPLVSHILRKVRRTRPQALLAPSQRRSNLRRAFEVAGSQPFSGATVLLADDVMTTGTTANEASRALLRGGAVRVVVAVVARGLGRR